MRFEEIISKDKLLLKKHSKVKVIEPEFLNVLNTIDCSNLKEFRKREKVITKENVSTPVELQLSDNHTIEVNTMFCTNPHCSNFGISQKSYTTKHIKNKEYQFGFTGGGNERSIVCSVCGSYSILTGNYPSSLELKRLIDIRTLTDNNESFNVRNSIHKDSSYYHNEGCEYFAKTPLDGSKYFRNKGSSYSGIRGTRYRCQSCGKTRTVNPHFTKNITKGFKNHHKLTQVARDLLHKKPLSQTAQDRSINMNVLYKYLTHIYERFLYFAQKKEGDFFKEHHFNSLNLSTDALLIFTNNQKRKYSPSKVKQNVILPLNTITTVCNDTGFVFRADISYDYNTTAEEVYTRFIIKNNRFITSQYTEFNRFNLSIYKSMNKMYDPTQNRNIMIQSKRVDSYDTKDKHRTHLLVSLGNRRHYQPGIHISEQYTAYAHYKLLQERLCFDEVNINMDGSLTLESSALKALYESVQKGNCHIIKHIRRADGYNTLFEDYNKYSYAQIQRRPRGSFDEHLTKISEDRILTKELAKFTEKYIQDEYENYINQGKTDIEIEDLMLNLETISNFKLSKLKLRHDLEEVDLKRKHIRMKHPYPTGNKKDVEIELITDFSGLPLSVTTSKLIESNMASVDRFFNLLRRKVHIFERPIDSSKKSGKNYAYAPTNIRYADYLLQIFTIYYNYCYVSPQNPSKVSKAQKMGIVDRLYSIQDIINGK